ncbi:alpha/beta hydrolase [Streptomyces sp. NPDC002688]|uniref:alpha/beta hydrolase n=1 Tax=Streptomyces sp. NPDC002688 TaxID=3154423 RepID=UPI00332496E1
MTSLPRGAAPARHALYLHGGAYIHEIIPRHWSLIAKTAVASSTRFTVPIYPVAPLGVAEDVVPAATDLAEEIIARVGADRTALLGDSAGGGMAMAVALQLRERGLAAPYRTVLISPWLDVSLTAPDIPALAAKDHFLAPAGLAAAGELYRGELPAEDTRVSPIKGDFSGLGPITLLSGTLDILHSDAKRFVPLARAAGVPVDYYEAPGMIHVFPLFPIPEAKRARQISAEALMT